MHQGQAETDCGRDIVTVIVINNNKCLPSVRNASTLILVLGHDDVYDYDSNSYDAIMYV